MLCVWWHQRGVVCYEVLKPGEMVNVKRYQQQLTDLNRSLLEKRPEYRKRHEVIFFMTMLHYKRSTRLATRWKVGWEVLPRAAYLPNLARSDYYLFASMCHALAAHRFGSYEDVKKYLDDRFTVKMEHFYCRCIHKLVKR